MLKPGPKSKGECPSDIHIRLNETQRKIVESLGPGSAQDKIISLILERGDKLPAPSLLEVQLKIAEIQKEIFRLQDQKDKWSGCLETQYGLSEAEIEQVYKQINDAIHGSKKVND